MTFVLQPFSLSDHTAMTVVVVQELKPALLVRPADRLLRLLQAIAAVSMLVLALDMVCMLNKSSETHPEMLHAALLTWISALLYGGVCGLVVTLTSRLPMATHVLVCWLLIAVFHTWYLIDGHYRLDLLPPSSSWVLMAKISADLLCVLFVAGVALAMRSKRLLPDSGGFLLHSVAPLDLVIV